MGKRCFKVGDRCRIRQWDDMEAEFGLIGGYGVGSSWDYIQCDASFLRGMKYMCGKQFTIKEIFAAPGCNYSWVRSEEGTETTTALGRGYWAISFDMLELCEPECTEFEGATYDDLVSLLS